MEYEKSLPFDGNPHEVMKVATATLTASGFRIDSRTNDALEFIGPRMNSSHGPPLAGASRVLLRVAPGSLSLQAELGGARRLIRMMMILILGLTILLDVPMTALAAMHKAPWWIPLVGLAWLVPWAILLPIISRVSRQRAIRALDALLQNLTVISSQ
jgi:hypothetical protein